MISFRKFYFVATIAAVATLGSATPWNNGTTDSNVNVGPSGDYTTLKACADAFNAVSGGVNANWTISLLAAGSPFIETTSTAIANVIASGKTVTMKPDAGASVTVQYITTPGSTAPTINGHMIIGATDINTANSWIAMNGFVIDGSNNGTNSQNLTLTDDTETTVRQVINVWGGTSNGVIKNCNIINNGQYNGGITAALRFTGRFNNATTYGEPNFWTVVNNNISNLGGTQAAGVECIASNAQTGTGLDHAINGLTVTSNTIIARQRGVHLSHNDNATVTNNRIRLVVVNTDSNTFAGIYHNSSNGGLNGVTAAFTQTLAGNTIDQLSWTPAMAADRGFHAIDLSNAPATSNGTFNVYNNTISGFDFPTTTPATALYVGIYSQANGSVFNVYHNSINMPNFSSVTSGTGTQQNRIGGIIVTTTGATFNVKNNIIRMFQDYGIGVYKINSSFTADGNDIFINAAGTSQRVGRIATTEYPTFASWQGAGYDLNGHNLDPAATAGASWTSANATDLHFFPQNVAAVGINGVSGLVPAVTTDIDGETRPGNTMAGADQSGSFVATAAQDWQLLN